MAAAAERSSIAELDVGAARTEPKDSSDLNLTPEDRDSGATGVVQSCCRHCAQWYSRKPFVERSVYTGYPKLTHL